jgi:hypothetical protein
MQVAKVLKVNSVEVFDRFDVLLYSEWLWVRIFLDMMD